jgi:acetylglutamate kinase
MRVIKIGGRAQNDPAVYDAIADAWRSAERALCVVHGGGDAVTSLQRSMGMNPHFVDGRRVTSAADIDVLRMALSGVCNKRIVAALHERGINAVGLSGEDGALIGALRVNDARLGEVGTPKEINVSLLQTLLDAGYLPVISPLGRSLADGAALNINGDDAAAAIAGALHAEELLLVADVPGVLSGGAVVPRLSAESAESLVQSGSATGGMIAKLQAALLALSSGVKSARIGSPEMILDSGAGTTITLTPSLV